MAKNLQIIEFRSSNQYKPGDTLITYEQIQERIKELAPIIAKKYKGKRLLVVGVLKGAFRVVADLTAELHKEGLTDLEISFITLKSYPTGTKAEDEPKIVQDMDINPDKRYILLVDDILDTGRSLQIIHGLAKERGAISTESFALLDKPERRLVGYKADYVGFAIPNIWVQGYGMDTKDIGRADSNITVGPYTYKHNE